MLQLVPTKKMLITLVSVILCFFELKAQIEFEGISEFKSVNIIKNKVDYYAVVVGIDEYINIRPLPYSALSASQFRNLLTSDYMNIPSKNVRLLTNGKAKRIDVLDLLENQFAKADSNDVLIFYFAGHGYDEIIAPHDYSKDIAEKSITYNDLNRIFKDSKAKRKICFLDACRDAVQTQFSQGSENKIFKDLFAKSSGFVQFLSTSKGADAWQIKELGLTVFTHFLIEGLKGKADENKDEIIELGELYNFVKRETQRYTKGSQIPELHYRENQNLLNMSLINLKQQ